MENKQVYTTDDRVKHFTQEKDINITLGEIIGEKFIKYRERWDAANRYELETDFPLFIQLDMDQKCNLTCIHCPLNNMDNLLDHYSIEKITWSDYEKIILEGEEHNCPSISHTGNNEPLLDKEFEKYLKYASDHGFFDIHMVTNATLLTEKRAKKLLDSGLARIRFSIDAASTESYRDIRHGNYNIVLRNINRFLELKEKGGYKLPVTGVNFCKIRKNEHEVENFFNYWSDKVDMVSVQTYLPPSPDKKYLEYYPTDQFSLESKLKDFQCPQPWQRVVLRNRYITPCCAFHPDLIMGDISKDSIHQVWNSKPMKELRNLHKNKEYYKKKACDLCAKAYYPSGSIQDDAAISPS